MWAAHMLRLAGIGHIVPREQEPYFIGRAAAQALVEFDRIDAALDELTAVLSSGRAGATSSQLAAHVRRLIASLKSMRKGLEHGSTTVLGEGRRKQVDVFVADWDRGLELLISTKTFALNADAGEIVKNLPNRWEEFDGDLKNLRGRFPLAVIGALAVVPDSVVTSSLPAFADMLNKITAPGRPWVNAYDRAALIVVKPWQQGSEHPVSIRNAELSSDQLPTELSPETFFTALLTRLLERAPISEHRDARLKWAKAQGLDTTVLERAVQAESESIQETQPPYLTNSTDDQTPS